MKNISSELIDAILFLQGKIDEIMFEYRDSPQKRDILIYNSQNDIEILKRFLQMINLARIVGILDHSGSIFK